MGERRLVMYLSPFTHTYTRVTTVWKRVYPSTHLHYSPRTHPQTVRQTETHARTNTNTHQHVRAQLHARLGPHEERLEERVDVGGARLGGEEPKEGGGGGRGGCGSVGLYM